MRREAPVSMSRESVARSHAGVISNFLLPRHEVRLQSPLVTLFAEEETRLVSVHSRNNVTVLGATMATMATFALDSLRS